MEDLAGLLEKEELVVGSRDEGEFRDPFVLFRQGDLVELQGEGLKVRLRRYAVLLGAHFLVRGGCGVGRAAAVDDRAGVLGAGGVGRWCRSRGGRTGAIQTDLVVGAVIRRGAGALRLSTAGLLGGIVSAACGHGNAAIERRGHQGSPCHSVSSSSLARPRIQVR